MPTRTPLRTARLRRAAAWGLLSLLPWVAVSGAEAAERARIAVLPVVVHSLDDPGYLREGLADMLASRLGRNPGIAVARIADPAHATTDPAAARAAAREAGAEYVLFGSFTRFGAGASLDLQCLPVRGEGDPRAIFIHAGALGEIIPQLDGLSEKVLRYVLNGADALPAAAGLARSEGPSGGEDARRELEALRSRVERLEQALGADAVARLPETTEPSGAEPASEVR